MADDARRVRVIVCLRQGCCSPDLQAGVDVLRIAGKDGGGLRWVERQGASLARQVFTNGGWFHEDLNLRAFGQFLVLCGSTELF